jgi:2-aminoadipate transaminase
MDSFAVRMSGVHRSFVREILKVTEDPSIISFAGGLPHPKSFPVREVAEAARAVLAEDGPAALQYSTTEGYLPLRELVARQYARKGVDVGPDEILIVNGSQQGLDLAAKVFLDAGDTVVVERPTYLAAIQAFSFFEPIFRAVPLEDDGICTEALARELAGQSPKLFYCVPNFQNPSGISYSVEKRQETARLLSSGSTVMVEDDPYGELRFLGEELPPVRSYIDDYASRAPGDAAILLGTFSKIVAPGLRIGWVCAGREIMERLIVAKQASDLHSNILSQRIVHRYLTDNDVAAHIALIRGMYRRQRDLMVRMVEQHFPAGARCTRPEGGMFLWVTLPEGMSAMDVFEPAIREKVAFVPGQAFFTDGGGENTMRLNFSNSDEERIEEGIKRLGAVLKAARGRKP